MVSVTMPRRPAPVLWELRAPAELGLFVAAAPLFNAAPPGSRRDVLLLPGFGASDLSMAPLRRLLRRVGHRPHGWGQGRNLGPTRQTIDGLVGRLSELANAAGEPVAVIGWSLGGIYARVLAQWYPDHVDQVISLGSPFNIGLREATTVDPVYEWLDQKHGFVQGRADIELDEVPCPSTAIFSRSDGVVAWPSCLQTVRAQAENVEVRGSHCALGANVAAAYVITDRLTRTRQDWEPFVPPVGLRTLYPVQPCAS